MAATELDRDIVGEPPLDDLVGSESEIEQLYQTAPIGLVLFDPELRYVRINQRLAEMNGLSVSDHIGRTVREVVPDLAGDAEALRDTFLAGGGPKTRIFTGTTPAQPGEVRHWLEHWSPMRAEDGTLIGINVAAEEITERKREEDRNRMLSLELRHRLKNTLAVVQGLAHATFKNASGAEELLEEFDGRITALAAAHRSLALSDWEDADVADIVKGTVTAVHPKRVTADGPSAHVSGDSAMNLALCLHELCTNAVKHGALSADEGTLSIRWHIRDGKVHLEWKEQGGPPVELPAAAGSGSQLLRRLLGSGNTEGRVDYVATGVVCRMAVPIAQQHST
jgi:two-component system CheB/CheR fusion protein